MKKVLFVCTANYYRSRFAEGVFNHLAQKRSLEWQAFSRGFIPEEAPEGISPHTLNGLKLVGVDPSLVSRDKQKLQEDDFAQAAKIIALKKDEHEPMMKKNFPQFTSRVHYWNVDDIPVLTPPEALLAIKTNVEELLDRLAYQTKEPH